MLQMFVEVIYITTYISKWRGIFPESFQCFEFITFRIIRILGYNIKKIEAKSDRLPESLAFFEANRHSKDSSSNGWPEIKKFRTI